ncbi:hypothetical protein [Ruminococcus sp.]|jgi:hypothetical protein|uniref:hypothetical protein n=1 Tax=Ruminococcus sp. TaxID=41978 RepID=UPI0025F853E6|nr:hypothetical protein [Ruminococcus sp.]
MKNMKIKSVLKKHWLIIGLVILFLSSVGMIVWARYVDANNSMKRTIVSLAETDEKRFTSNLLTRTESPSPKTYPVSNSALEGDYYRMQVIVRNYTPTDTLHFYDKDINYTFTAELVNVAGTAITAQAKATLVRYGTTNTEFTPSGGKYVVTATGTLSKDQNGTHDITYTFYFHKDLLDASDNVFVKIAATPTGDDSILADVGSLQGIIGISRQATEIVKTWSGTFSDEGAADSIHVVEASTYDGFNYIIQGNGERKVSLKWDHTKLELNPFSIEELKTVSNRIDSTLLVEPSIDGNYTTIVFMVDSEECPRYDVQFYMKGTELSTWNTVIGAVTFNPNVTT